MIVEAHHTHPESCRQADEDRIDEEEVEEIFILPIEETKENKALLNRLNKAISKK